LLHFVRDDFTHGDLPKQRIAALDSTSFARFTVSRAEIRTFLPLHPLSQLCAAHAPLTADFESRELAASDHPLKRPSGDLEKFGCLGKRN
jgi:hypothetical protein